MLVREYGCEMREMDEGGERVGECNPLRPTPVGLKSSFSALKAYKRWIGTRLAHFMAQIVTLVLSLATCSLY